MPSREFTASFLDALYRRAEAAPRRRQHHNIHTGPDEPVQRLFNAICPDSYIRPHCHRVDPKHELLMAIRGRFVLVIFDDAGTAVRRVPFGSSAELAAGAEVAPEEWHTVIATEAGSILLEIKQGPFDASAAKELAPWSPEEGSTEANDYLRHLHSWAGIQHELQGGRDSSLLI